MIDKDHQERCEICDRFVIATPELWGLSFRALCAVHWSCMWRVYVNLTKMIYGDSWINSLAFASLCRWFFCQGFCASVSLQYGPEIMACLNVWGFVPPPAGAEGEKSSYQHGFRMCKHSSLAKIWGLWTLGVVINYQVMNVIILVKTRLPYWHGQSPDRCPSFPALLCHIWLDPDLDVGEWGPVHDEY